MALRKYATKGMSQAAKFQWCFFLIASLLLYFIHESPLVLAGLLSLQLLLQLTTTRTGREVTGIFFNIQSWRNGGASQKTYFLRWFTGFPIAYILFSISRSDYVYIPGNLYYQFVVDSNDSLVAVMAKLGECIRNTLPGLLRAGCLSGSIMMGISTLLKTLQLTEVRRIYSSIQAGNEAQDIISRMTWEQFEKIIRLHFELCGFKSTLTETGADGGVDIRLRKNGRREMVQCKHWKSSKVGVSVVREIYGVIQADKYDHGYIITSGLFTEDAWSFVLSENVKGKISLIDGSKLLQIIKGKETGQPAPHIVNIQPDMNEGADPCAIPNCPLCHSKMVKRLSNGNPFYGCSVYPICKGTRNF